MFQQGMSRKRIFERGTALVNLVLATFEGLKREMIVPLALEMLVSLVSWEKVIDMLPAWVQSAITTQMWYVSLQARFTLSAMTWGRDQVPSEGLSLGGKRRIHF